MAANARATGPQPALNDKFRELRTRLAEIHDLNKVAGMLGWDQQV